MNIAKIHPHFSVPLPGSQSPGPEAQEDSATGAVDRRGGGGSWESAVLRRPQDRGRQLQRSAGE